MKNTNGVFPVPNSTLPYWRSELHEIDSIRTTEELPEECDVVIIGAGLSGVSTAYHLLDANPSPPSIVLLEAREICSGATGRNGGHVTRSWGTVGSMSKQYGPEMMKELSQFVINQIYAMKATVDKEKLDCDALLTRYMETYLVQSEADEAKQVFDEQLAAGYDYVEDVNYIKRDVVENISGIKGAKAGITLTSLQLWPYKFVTGLLAILLDRRSINVQTRTPVTSISTLQDGVSAVKTPRGSIRAKKVVFATNGYTVGILPKYAKKIVPWKITCSHISTPTDTCYPPPHLNHTYGLNFADGSRDYIIPRPDGGVICGGAKSTYFDDRKSWENNWDDSTLLEPARAHFESVMQDNFRGWENSGAAVDYLWTGIIGHTADGLPHCGKVPGQDNHFILAGYNGGGMALIFLTAKGVAKMIRDDVPYEESGIPSFFKTTEERLTKEAFPA